MNQPTALEATSRAISSMLFNKFWRSCSFHLIFPPTPPAHLRPHDIAKALVGQLLRNPALALRIGRIGRYALALSGDRLLERQLARYETCRSAGQCD
jgi:hypothetical protein